MLQHGAYTLLIDACYDRERFPTMAEAIDWAWASLDEEINAVEFVLGKFFTLGDDGRYQQERIGEELDKYHANAKTNKRIAQEREAKRKEKSTKRVRSVNDSPQKDNESPPKDNESPPNQEPLTKNQEPKTKNQEPKTINQTPEDQETLPDKSDAMTVFDYWLSVMDRGPRTHATPKRITNIKSRLKDGYTVDEIKLGIDGCTKSSYHMGENNRATKYNDIELICRSGEKLEAFIGMNEKITPKADVERDREVDEWINEGTPAGGQGGVMGSLFNNKLIEGDSQ